MEVPITGSLPRMPGMGVRGESQGADFVGLQVPIQSDMGTGMGSGAVINLLANSAGPRTPSRGGGTPAFAPMASQSHAQLQATMQAQVQAHHLRSTHSPLTHSLLTHHPLTH